VKAEVTRRGKIVPRLIDFTSALHSDIGSAPTFSNRGIIMPDIADGETVEMQGSARLPYQLTNRGGVYSCSCPAWRNQSVGIERRTCKHLQKYRGAEAEQERLGSALPARPVNEDGDATSDAPPLLLAHTWDNETDLSGWWMSEKLDGVRAYWNACSGYLICHTGLSRRWSLFSALPS